MKRFRQCQCSLKDFSFVWDFIAQSENINSRSDKYCCICLIKSGLLLQFIDKKKNR